jgi:predicted MFS family arabinose efflux permease
VGAAAHGSWWQETRAGLRYITDRAGLAGLMLIFMGIHFFAALAYFSILPAMILARTGNDELALATVQSALGIGGVVGGLLLSLWGGPRRLIHAIFTGTALSYLLGDFVFAIGRSLEAWVIAAFSAAVFIPFISGANRAIWQAKVAPDMQGRVFSIQWMLQSLALALGYLAAGPLADRLFEPAMQPGGALAGVFGGLVGTGPGAGMALIFVCTATCGALISLSGYFIPALRNVENDLPDYDLTPAGSTAAD